ncbi:hypothetical protein [Streptomyces sp. NPDC048659]|uniref:lipase family alpha/beta hydrolase n=1 Tax=Streptomyces sp. NPDC048659 TaxID=3155489 RepID=UPI00342DD586
MTRARGAALPLSRKGLLAAAALAALVVPSAPPPLAPVAATAPTAGPALRTPVAALAEALDCDARLDLARGRTPILLVPGTIESAEQVYDGGYRKVLGAAGHPVCVIRRLRGGGLGDLQENAEYVVYAVRAMEARAGRRISVIGHSQGGTLPLWALRFWPDLSGRIDDFVALAGAPGGVTLATVLCLPGRCPEAAWQFRPGSNWTTALRAEPLPRGTDVTSIGSATDEIVQPSPRATSTNGGTDIVIQRDLCPLRLVGHLSILVDAAAYALTRDALDHPGPADPKRVGRAACAKTAFTGVDARMARTVEAAPQLVADAVFRGHGTDREPALRGYAARRQDAN